MRILLLILVMASLGAGQYRARFDSVKVDAKAYLKSVKFGDTYEYDLKEEIAKGRTSNFVYNPFFSDNASGWTLGSNASIVQVGKDTSKTEYALYFKGGGGSGETAYQNIYLKDHDELYPGQTISVSYWALAQAARAARLNITFYDDQNNSTGTAVTSYTTLSDNQLSRAYEEKIVIPANTTRIYFYFLNNDAPNNYTNKAWISMPALVVGDIATAGYAYNPDFEHANINITPRQIKEQAYLYNSNPFQNPVFSSGEYGDYVIAWNGQDGGSVAGVVDADNPASAKALKITMNANSRFFARQIIDFSDMEYPLTTGDTLVFGYWVYADQFNNSTGSLRAYGQWRDANDNVVSSFSGTQKSASIVAGKWYWYETLTTTVPSGVSRILIGTDITTGVNSSYILLSGFTLKKGDLIALNGYAKGDWYVRNIARQEDNKITFSQLNYQPFDYDANVIKNPLFADGTSSDYWFAWNPQGTGSIVGVVDKDSPFGGKALKINFDATTRSFVRQYFKASDFTPRLVPGDTISMSLYANLEATGSGYWMRTHGTNGGTGNVYGDNIYDATNPYTAGKWVKLYNNDVIISDTSITYYFGCDLYPATATNGYVTAYLVKRGGSDIMTNYEENKNWERKRSVEINAWPTVSAKVDSTVDARAVTATSIPREIRQYVYGSKIQNTLSSLSTGHRDFKDTVRIRLIGNSIASGGSASSHQKSYFYLDSVFLTQQYPNAVIDFKNVSYGGYNMDQFVKYFESEVVEPNIDLWIFAEYESDYKRYHNEMRNMFEIVRRKSTAEIALQTWNPRANDPVNDAALSNALKYYRDLARRYNVELMDTWRAFKDTIATGVSIYQLIDTTGGNKVHPNDRGHNIYYQVFKEHFDTTAYNRYNIPSYNADAIQTIELEDGMQFYDSSAVNYYGNWTIGSATVDSISSFVINSSSVNDSIVIPFSGTGVKIQYIRGNAYGTFNVYIDGIAPSAIRVNSRPLEYATIVTWDAANANNDRFYRFFKALILKNATPGQYRVQVTDAANSTYTLYDPASNSLGTGTWTTDFTSSNGAIFIPKNYGGGDQWLNPGSYVNGDKFYFTVKRKYIDAVNTAGVAASRGTATIMGLKNGQYKLKIVHSAGGTVSLDAVRIYQPVRGRK